MMDVTDEPLLDAELSLFSETMTLATFEKLALQYLLIKKVRHIKHNYIHVNYTYTCTLRQYAKRVTAIFGNTPQHSAT